MVTLYGKFALDPLVLSAIVFPRIIRRAYCILRTDKGEFRSQTYIQVRHRRGVAAAIIFYSSLMLPKDTKITEMTYVVETLWRPISITFSVLSYVDRPGSYTIIYSTCVRSTQPILFVAE